jgi:putative flippase GtrA
MLFRFDQGTNHAIEHTIHCLVGCGIGEVLGMLIASVLGWHRIARTPIAIALAFIIGYSLTYRGVRKQADSASDALKITFATDTVSIFSMELVDNTIELIIPNALVVTAASFRFWWGLTLALVLAFVITVPVNRYMMAKYPAVAHKH